MEEGARAVVKQGIAGFMAKLDGYVGKMRIGLVTSPSAVDGQLRSTLDLLTAAGGVSALFGLEHGLRGNAQAGEKVETGVDPRTGLPVYSLYGANLKPTKEMLEQVDCLVFDVQDVGVRLYTYLYSLLYLLEAAAEANLRIFVLDRPNPLGGEVVSGGILEESLQSFVGYPIPIRYGLTIGEMALFFNETRRIGADLTVVKMEGWQREFTWKDTGLPWVPPSPNMPTTDTVLVYPGTCLVEGTNLSEGRGTCRPFELIGAPWVDPYAWAEELNNLGLPGAAFRPTYFTPMFSKHKDKVCGGVQLHVLDGEQFSPISTAVHLLSVTGSMYDEFEFLGPSKGRYFFDLLAGTTALRELIQKRDQQGVARLLEEWEQQAQDFAAMRREYFLY